MTPLAAQMADHRAPDAPKEYELSVSGINEPLEWIIILSVKIVDPSETVEKYHDPPEEVSLGVPSTTDLIPALKFQVLPAYILLDMYAPKSPEFTEVFDTDDPLAFKKSSLGPCMESE
jgi:hypothetical protein